MDIELDFSKVFFLNQTNQTKPASSSTRKVRTTLSEFLAQIERNLQNLKDCRCAKTESILSRRRIFTEIAFDRSSNNPKKEKKFNWWRGFSCNWSQICNNFLKSFVNNLLLRGEGLSKVHIIKGRALERIYHRLGNPWKFTMEGS